MSKITQIKHALVVCWKMSLITSKRTISEKRLHCRLTDLPKEVQSLIQQDTLPARYLTPLRALKERIERYVRRYSVDTTLGRVTSREMVTEMQEQFVLFEAELDQLKAELISKLDEAGEQRERELEELLAGHPLSDRIIDVVRAYRPDAEEINSKVTMSYLFYSVESPQGYTAEMDKALREPIEKMGKSLLGRLIGEVVDDLAVLHAKQKDRDTGQVAKATVKAVRDAVAKFDRLESLDPRVGRLIKVFGDALSVFPDDQKLEGSDALDFETLLEAAVDKNSVLDTVLNGSPLVRVSQTRSDAFKVSGATKPAPKAKPMKLPNQSVQPSAAKPKPKGNGWSAPLFG